jgi:serine/threonine-protein kinase RsbW
MSRPDELILEELPGRPEELLEVVVRLAIPSVVRLVDPAVELLSRRCFADLEASRQAQFRLRVALAEALANAIQCGNRNDPAKLVRISANLFPDHIRVCVSDEGSGFDPGEIPDPRDPVQVQSPCGRGLFLIRNLAQEVEFNEKGNTIWMTLPRR